MATILKCPRCLEKIEVLDLSRDRTVRCEACGTLVRLTSDFTPLPFPP